MKISNLKSEHRAKVERLAAEAGIPPQEFFDAMETFACHKTTTEQVEALLARGIKPPTSFRVGVSQQARANPLPEVRQVVAPDISKLRPGITREDASQIFQSMKGDPSAARAAKPGSCFSIFSHSCARKASNSSLNSSRLMPALTITAAIIFCVAAVSTVSFARSSCMSMSGTSRSPRHSRKPQSAA